MKIIKKEHQAIAKWSGGTTRQIYIYPEGSDYASRQFDWRLSSATVDCESSTFTPLPGVHRHLMILEGKLQLIHQDHYQVELAPLEQDQFEGSWHTLSFGKVIDFNLMLKNGRGILWPVEKLSAGSIFSQTEKEACPQSAFKFFYLHQGSADISGHLLQAGDFILCHQDEEMICMYSTDQLIAVKGMICQ